MKDSYSSFMASCQWCVSVECMASWIEDDSCYQKSTTHIWDSLYGLMIVNVKFPWCIDDQWSCVGFDCSTCF
jgi:hypothetical protein